MKFDWTQLFPVLTNCRQLRKLVCDTCTFNGSEEQFMEVAATSHPAATNITNLEVTNSSGEGKVSLVDWINMCPRLETLSVTSDNTTQIGPILQFSPGPQLSRLSLDCERFEDTELAEVLARCTSMEELSLDSATISRQVFAALSGHFGSLISLDLSSELVDEQWMVKGIFEGCPRLEGLYLYAVDVDNLYNTCSEENLPWACRNSLKELCIMQIQLSLDTTVNDRFTKQLMDLKQLVQLATEAMFRWDGSTRIFEPRNAHEDTLESRLLDKLLECKHLELSSYDLQQDPRWSLVRDAWPKLTSFFYNGVFYDSD
ncbi:hypothetical protein BGZ68_001459 [Mortierella alpina]|nr:hypothetical protein BGZ68_001459 [Mortierella alpina]